ncbi:MAG: Grx4 family monothiol glutaredoxin [Myxococcota bacterium]|nr:Grx4 family monothiol glutaredoxin [Myxococcota bacterium]
MAEVVKANPVTLFMKGSPKAPQCGFSASAAGILGSYGVPFHTVDVLIDPDVREQVKTFSSWPTLPQVYIGGEFVGGSDILGQLHESGELKGLIEKASQE